MLPTYVIRILALGALLGSTIAEPINVAERSTLAHCSNDGKIKRVKPEYKGSCHPNNSKGFRSSHNCFQKEKGKSYLCVQGGKATCYSSGLNSLNFENGECFIRK